MSVWQWLFGKPSMSDDWTDFVRRTQERLAAHGYDPGPVDGKRGNKTDAALVKFKKARGLRARPYIGPLTVTALEAPARDPETTQDATANGADEPHWMPVARSYLGLREIPGPRHESRIVSMWKAIGATWFNDDETPWCGAFVGAVLKESGFAILPAGDAPRARAWMTWGRKLIGPAVGAVVVFWRGSPDGASGHVGFVVGRDEANRLMVLGGNQSNAVTIDPFDRARVLAYRWPAGEPLPDAGLAHLPIVDSGGRPSSRDEA